MRGSLSTVLIGTILAAGCSAERLPEPSRAADCPSRESNSFYFIPEEDGQPSGYYSQFLGAIDPPSLSCGHSVDQGYRLNWLAPGRLSTIIEVLHTGNGWTLHAGQFAEATYRQPVVIRRQFRRKITAVEVRALIRAFDEAHFWGYQPARFSGLYDGPLIAIEARRASSYRVVFTWTLADIERRLFEMAQLKPE
jgi:hypothetical protein